MASSDTDLSLEDNTNGEGGDAMAGSSQLRCPIPNEYTSLPKHGDSICKEKEAALILRPKYAYENTEIAGPNDTIPDTHTYQQPVEAELVYLHVGDHVVVYSGHGSKNPYGYEIPGYVSMGHGENPPSRDYERPEDAHVYKESENVSSQDEYSPSYDYEKPKDAHTYKEPENLSTGTGLDDDSPSDDHEEPEDGNENPEGVSFAFKAKSCLMGMWNMVNSRKIFKVALGCGLLAITLAILAPRLIPGKENEDCVVTTANIMKSGTPWRTTMYKENSSALNNLTPASPLENTSNNEETLPTTVASLSTTDMNECKGKPCQHGTCENIQTGYNCFCQAGWTGQNCQQDLNECTTYPCHHGLCVNKDGGYSCTCWPGWTGQNCLQDINECTTNPCQHGRCENKDGGYKCTCSPGWTGRNCQQDINECTRNPCQHGSCVNRDGGYKCICQHGWTGTHCHQPIPCQSGWTEYDNHCYKFFGDKVSWSTANGRCKHNGANLASVGSGGENDFIARLISGAPKGPTRYLVWFGLNRVNGHWKWTDGSPLAYKNWAPGEPGNNVLWRTVDCANMYSKDSRALILGAKGKKGEWNDSKCSAKLSYVCKTRK